MSFDDNKHPETLERGSDNIAYLIKVLHETQMKLIGEQMKEFELTAAQWHPIALIGLNQANTPAELARIIEVDTGAMTRMLDRLEAKEFLYRTRCEQDRRVIKLHLTEKGNRVTNKLVPAVGDVMNVVLKGLSHEEFTLLQKLLMRMLLNIRPDIMELLNQPSPNKTS